MNIIVEYRRPGAEAWSMMIAAPGETYEQAAVALLAFWPGSETRQRKLLCEHGVDLWAACAPCHREINDKNRLLGS